jgi:excisionase family DNA binding protein
LVTEVTVFCVAGAGRLVQADSAGGWGRVWWLGRAGKVWPRPYPFRKSPYPLVFSNTSVCQGWQGLVQVQKMAGCIYNSEEVYIMDKKLMTVEEVAQIMQVPRSTIYQLVFYCRIPVLRISRRMIRFDPDEIQKWLAEKSQVVSPRFRSRNNQGTVRTGRPRGRPPKHKIDHLVEQAKREVLT